MTLIVKNADSKVLGVLESLKALKPELEISKEKETKQPNIKLHTAIEECEKILKNPHQYPSYKNAKELLKDCLNEICYQKDL
uniref:Uncharacterized protein n=1 Tax=uncultured Helicobacter sp. TaxID=175537 RepID=A0A650EL24_9HELI|nr:hypothetical protein Helico5904_1010 [uncultured Helicobacter sp.]